MRVTRDVVRGRNRLRRMGADVGGRRHGIQERRWHNVLSHRHAYDSLSNLTSRIDDNGSGNGQAVSELFSYDPINRLLQYQVASPAIANLNRTVDLQYNAVGNILFKTDVGVYSYTAQGPGSTRPHAVSSVNGVDYTEPRITVRKTALIRLTHVSPDLMI